MLPGPDWKWIGLVLNDGPGRYRAVMPVPLRRKYIAGIAYAWVVHQPLFCQFLTVFSGDDSIDPALFLRSFHQQYRYGSVLRLALPAHTFPDFKHVRTRTTQVIDLAAGYENIRQHYTRDRHLNLRRAAKYGWTLTDSTDPQPMLALFRSHHADGIDGGVGEWAYELLKTLIQSLQQRGMATIRYAERGGQIEAGVLLVQQSNRIIYLFNAASETGRRGNARTLLIDRAIRASAGMPVLFDFESPQKESIKNFYQSFGATEETHQEVRWSRLTLVETGARRLLSFIRHLNV